MKRDCPKYLAPLPWGSPGGQPTRRPPASTQPSTETLPIPQPEDGQTQESRIQSDAFQALESEKNKFFTTIFVLSLLGIALGAVVPDGAIRSSGEVIAQIACNLVLALSWLLVMAFVLYGTERWAKQCCKWGSEILTGLLLVAMLVSLVVNSITLLWCALLVWQVSILDKDIKYYS